MIGLPFPAAYDKYIVMLYILFYTPIECSTSVHGNNDDVSENLSGRNPKHGAIFNTFNKEPS